MDMSSYKNMNIEELHIHMNMIKSIIRTHDTKNNKDYQEQQEEKFKKLFMDSLLRMKDKPCVENMITLYFDCNCVGFNVYPTREELKNMIERVF